MHLCWTMAFMDMVGVHDTRWTSIAHRRERGDDQSAAEKKRSMEESDEVKLGRNGVETMMRLCMAGVRGWLGAKMVRRRWRMMKRGRRTEGEAYGGKGDEAARETVAADVWDLAAEKLIGVGWVNQSFQSLDSSFLSIISFFPFLLLFFLSFQQLHDKYLHTV